LFECDNKWWKIKCWISHIKNHHEIAQKWMSRIRNLSAYIKNSLDISTIMWYFKLIFSFWTMNNHKHWWLFCFDIIMFKFQVSSKYKLNKHISYTLHINNNLLHVTKQKLQLSCYSVELVDFAKNDWNQDAKIKVIQNLANY